METNPAVDPDFLVSPCANLFFTGKGGVGKTTCACAAAVRMARSGKRVLLVSTDPASNLDQVLGLSLGLEPVEVPEVPGLTALNLDPERAAAEYRRKVVEPVRGVLPEGLVRSMEEQLSGACTVEIAAFDLFSGILAGAERPPGVDVVVFDTAPTGHTLRLLKLPAAWTGFLESNTTGNTCLGPLQGLAGKQSLYAEAVKALADPARSAIVLVSRAQAASLREAERTRRELVDLGVSRLYLVVNGLLRGGDDPVALSWERRARVSLEEMSSALAGLPRASVPLNPSAFQGIAALGNFFSARPSAPPESVPVDDFPSFPSWEELIEDLATRSRGLIMTMGKGGVGKTIVAAKIAEALAGRGLPVILATTDPACHAVEACSGSKLEVVSIDPGVETAAYRAEVLAGAGAGLDEEGLALLDEDLRSPCTEEIAVFRAFARIVDRGTDSLVVCDTAPTGHTLLLLDATRAYHRELGRRATAGVPESVLRLLPRLREPEFNRILIVTLPEATPVEEAVGLERDLARAGMAPHAWVVNQTLGLTSTRDPMLCAKAAGESVWLRKVVELADRSFVLPWCEEFLY